MSSKIMMCLPAPACLSLCLSVRLSMCMPVQCVCVCPSVHPSVHPSIRPSIHPSIRPSVRPSVRLSMSVCLLDRQSRQPVSQCMSVSWSVGRSVSQRDRQAAHLSFGISVYPSGSSDGQNSCLSRSEHASVSSTHTTCHAPSPPPKSHTPPPTIPTTPTHHYHDQPNTPPPPP